MSDDSYIRRVCYRCSKEWNQKEGTDGSCPECGWSLEEHGGESPCVGEKEFTVPVRHAAWYADLSEEDQLGYRRMVYGVFAGYRLMRRAEREYAEVCRAQRQWEREHGAPRDPVHPGHP